MLFNKFRLEDITDKIGDGIHGTPEYDDNGEFYFVNGNNLVDGDIVFKSDTKRINKEQYVKNKRDLNNNTLLVSINGTLGNVAKYKNEKIILGKSACYINIKDEFNVDYVYFVFESPAFKKYLQYGANGTTIKNVPLSAIRNYEISIPSKENQDKIVKILKTIEDKIKLNNKINNNLYELVNNILLNDLEYENLDEFRLDELFYQITPGTNYQPERVESGIPFLNVKNINNGYIDFSDSKYISVDDYEKVHKTWQPEVNDLLISRIGTLGLVAVIREEDLPLAVHYNFLDFKTNRIPFEFCYFMFKSKYFQDKYRFNVKNSVQEYVTVDDIRKIEIKIPSMECMEKYKSFYNKILNIQRENKALSQLRDTLLPKLMNGEIDLDNIEI